MPNKVTGEVREVFKKIFDRLAPQAQNWIARAAEEDPGRGADLLLRLAEFHIPKLGRTEITGAGGGPLALHLTIDLGGKNG